MRTQEQQIKNINVARGYHAESVTEAIRSSGYGDADRETMTRIINARYNRDALRLYEDADTAVREYLQDIIEETIYGRTEAQTEELTKRYQLALDQIGGAEVLMALPGSIKAILQKTTDLKAKTEMLEAIAEIKTM